MQRLLTISVWVLLGVGTAFPAYAAEPAGVAPANGEELSSLPAYLTEEEQRMPRPQVALRDYLLRSPPTGTVYCPAEYEHNDGLIIAWEQYTDLLTAMTVSITTLDPSAIVYVVVDSASEQTTASSALSSAGADMTQVQFIIRTTDTVWMRDYGPRSIIENGSRAIIDHTYNRPRPNDDAFNDYLATLWGVPQYDIPLTHGGGNFHLFSNHDAFMTTLIQTENPSLTAQQIKDLYLQYQNVNLTIYTGFPTSFDSTQHIDMWMLPVGDNKVIIGQYPSSSGQPYTITEGAVTDLTARGYTVYRTPGWNSGGTGGGTHYTYTNAVIFNDLVFISKFGSPYTTQDATALSVFQTALPGKTIQQLNSASIITAAGAMHCIVMHVPTVNTNPVVTVQAPNGGETWTVGESHTITWTATDGGGVTGIDISYSTDGGATYPHVIATGEANDGVYAWSIPNVPSTQCRVKVVAHDADANTGEDMSNANFTIASPALAPQRVYAFPLDTDPGWSTEGQWAFGDPTGAGTHNKDPNTGYTGANVYGYNLNGDYPNSMMTTFYLTTAAMDCAALTGTELRFRRWLGVERFDDAALEVSSNGTTWTTVWSNPTDVSVSDATWSLQTYSLAAVADGEPTVYVRWGMGPTDSGTSYPGWNLDDIEIWGVLPLPCDVNGDHWVDELDYAAFHACLTGGPGGGLGTGCTPADLDEDGDVDLGDFADFQICYGAP